METRGRWKFSMIAGVTLAAVPLISAVAMIGLSYRSPLSRLLYAVYGLGLPGLLSEAIIMSRREPHGGGTPLEMVLIALPINILFYTLLSYMLISITAKLRRGSKF
jgi:hypothetical protein